jgi:Ni/Co efflux regulator RcnB
MKKTLAIAAVLCGALGFNSIASAQSTPAEVWQRQADAHGYTPHSSFSPYGSQIENRAAIQNQYERQDRYANRDRFANRDRYVRPSYPQYSYNHPHFYRGGYLPYEYRQPGYYINDWSAYPGLYAPPYGYQWMQVGDDFLLVALASGLIANLLTAR